MSAGTAGARAPQMLVLASTATLAATWHELDPALANLLAAAAILVFGLPHGAFDRLIALSLIGVHPGRRFATGLFVALYLLIAAAVAGTWLCVPSLMLTAFLALSVIHFGAGDGRGSFLRRGLRTLAHGGVVVVVLPFFHPAEVTSMFAHLSDPDSARWLRDVLRILAPAWLAASVLHAAVAVILERDARQPVEILALSAAFAALPVLPGFLLYFGYLHGPRHVAASITFLESRGVARRAALTEAAVLSVLTFLGFVMAGLAMPSGSTGATVQRTLFIGLAALTVPHMLLVDAAGSWRRSRFHHPQPGPA